MKYEIVRGESVDELEAKVQVRLRDGWRPQGGVYALKVIPSPPKIVFYQAVVKEE